MDNAFEVKKQNVILAKVTTDGDIVDANGNKLSDKLDKEEIKKATIGSSAMALSAGTGTIHSASELVIYYTATRVIDVMYRILINNCVGRPSLTVTIPSEIPTFSGIGDSSNVGGNKLADTSSFSHTAGANSMFIGQNNFISQTVPNNEYCLLLKSGLY